MQYILKLGFKVAMAILMGFVVIACGPGSDEEEHENPTSSERGVDLRVSKSPLVTNQSGYAYTEHCLAQGVPAPPRFNYNDCKGAPQGAACGSGWVYVNQSVTTLNGGSAEVFYYVAGPTLEMPNQPEGLCVAFPRFLGGPEENLVGVICQGKAASKACFWDSPASGFTATTNVCYRASQGGSMACAPAKGGAELADEPLAQCSDCHAGENAFVNHPADLALKSISPYFAAANWVQPIVKESWPQDSGPGLYFLSETATDTCSSGGCHGRDSTNRFPELSRKNKDFCFRLLGYENGVVEHVDENGIPFLSSNVVGSTMPLTDPTSVMDPTLFESYNALVAACDMPERYGRLARSLFYHNAGRAPTPREATHLGNLMDDGQTFPQVQDHIVRPSLQKLSPTDADVVIDGTPESIWAFRSTPHVVNHKLLGDITDENDLSATWRGMWDDEYLYVFVTVFDSERQTTGTPVYQDDSVEIYIDGHRDGGNSYDLNDFQYLFRPGDATVHVGGGRSNMSSANVVHGYFEFLGGYNIEVAIPWATLGVSPGGQMGLEIHVNDDDDNGFRDAQISWRTTAANSWTVPSNFTAVDLVTPLLFASTPVSVNGFVDEPTWHLPAAEPLTRQAWPIPPSDNAAVWQARWDADNLYVFVRVEDSNILPPDGPKPYHDDSVEISIDANNGHDGPIDFFDDFQFIFRVGESGFVHRGDVSADTDLDSIQSALVLTATGYDLEVAIPWTSLKTAAVDRATIGIEIQVNDDDTGSGTANNEREGKIAFCSNSNESYHDTRYYCVKKLEAPNQLISFATNIPRIARNNVARDPGVPGVLSFDGTGSGDPIWGYSYPAHSIANPILGSPSTGGIWRGAWNEEYLYFHFIVTEEEVPQNNSGNLWYMDDSVELYIDGNNNRGSTYDAFDLNYLFKPGMAFNGLKQVGYHSKGFLGKDKSMDGVKVLSQISGTLYQMEVAIPWSTLHIAPEPGLQFGLEVHINDDDAQTGPDRDGKVAWFGAAAMGDVAWERPDAFGVVQLGD